MRIILTGATGLIGSRFEELMFEKHDIIPLSFSNGIDITDKNSIISFLENKETDVVIHLAGKTDVDGCEEDKNPDLEALGVSESEILNLNVNGLDNSRWIGKTSAFAVNTIGTKNLCEVAKEHGWRFVYISTDFVFSGNDESYSEQSAPNPVDWYGMTKYLGEKVVGEKDLIVRLSFPYGYESSVKKDLFWKLHDLLEKNKEVSLVSDQIITPTFIDDIVNGLDYLLSKKAEGIYHLSGGNSLSPMVIGEKIKQAFGFLTKINPSNLNEIYQGKAPRPFQSIMKNDRLVGLGFTPKTFDKGLELIKSSRL